MLVPLGEATRDECGGKAATLGVLLRAGLPVPDGFVVPHVASNTASASEGSLRSAVARELARLGDLVVAVRSSAANEDGGQASAAGQYESVIGVRGVDNVCAAIETCWASAETARVEAYWNHHDQEAAASTPGMGVLVQRMIDAEVAGVMFTRPHQGGSTRIEAAWGLGVGVVGGTVTPDSYEVAPDGTVAHAIGSKGTRIDLDIERGGIPTARVPAAQQNARALDDAMAVVLAELGNRVARIQGSPQDIEWAITGNTPWILQARPITSALPQVPKHQSRASQALRGAAGAPGTVTAAARIVRGPSDFQAVQPGDIIVCPYTDPTWTPLFSIAAGVVTEIGGVLSHAAIVAREYGIPAVLGVAGVTTRIDDGARTTLDGTAGTVTVL